MIENFSKRRMLAGIGGLTILTIFVLIIESNWTVDQRATKQFIVEKNSTCMIGEEFDIVEECHPCTSFEIASRSSGVCISTHNKEVLQCKSGKRIARSCDKVAWLEANNFWTFELSLGCFGAITTILSYLRQKSLDQKTQRRIQKQLQQGV